jgi:hypothetical protein
VSARRWPTAVGVAGFAAGYVLFVAVRYWQFDGHGWAFWQDTTGYVATAKLSLTSLDLWAGARAPGFPLLVKLTGHDYDATVGIQFWCSVFAWGFLAFTVGRMVRSGWPRWLGTGLVLAFACTRPVTQWDRQLLSESLSLSFLALALAASLWFAHRRTWPRAIAVIVAAMYWCSLRDPHALVLGVAGVTVLAAVIVSQYRHRAPEVSALVVGVALLLTAGVAQSAADRGGRELLPVSNVYAARILAFPDRLDWFLDHGMPQATRLRQLSRQARAAGRPVAVIVPAIANDARDPTLTRYHEWLVDHGQRLLLEYAITHPRYLVLEPFERPERGFNSLGGWAGYAPNHREVPLLDRILFPPWPFVVLEFVAAVVVATIRRLRSIEWWVALGWAAAAVVHLGAAWHADAQELARHALIPDVQFRIATIVAIALAANALSGAPRASASPDRGSRRRDDSRIESTLFPRPDTSTPADHVDSSVTSATDPARR